MRKQIYILLALLLFSTADFAQATFRVMTYNILNYPSANGSQRNPSLKKILERINPDILVVEEIESQSGVNSILSNVLDSTYKAGTFINGPDTDKALFYRESLFVFVGNAPIPTNLRNINKFTLAYKPTMDTIVIFAVHLKASSGTTNEQQRLAEVTILRNVSDDLPDSSNFMVLGDFNIYTSSEPAYQKLLDQSSAGYVIDPINKPGSWNNNFSFAKYHTQSTSTSGVNGGAGGGLDDRFDQILVSQELLNTGDIDFLAGSYNAYGNDGLHFNKSINDPPSNLVVPGEIADALVFASDHLPVYADFIVDTMMVTSVEDEISLAENFELFQNYPNPFNPTTIISIYLPRSEYIELNIYDILGNNVTKLFVGTLEKGEHRFSFDGSRLSSGFYVYSLSYPGKILSNKMMLIK